MTKPFTDGAVRNASLICASVVGGERVRFESTPSDLVLIQLGASEALIKREEIAALAALFPVHRDRQFFGSVNPQ